jgi:hypothetical protein
MVKAVAFFKRRSGMADEARFIDGSKMGLIVTDEHVIVG